MHWDPSAVDFLCFYSLIKQAQFERFGTKQACNLHDSLLRGWFAQLPGIKARITRRGLLTGLLVQQLGRLFRQDLPVQGTIPFLEDFSLGVDKKSGRH